jgi:hypothetical protein
MKEIKHYKFSEVARAERFFTATILSHIFMANYFEGLKSLMRTVYKDKINEQNSDFELVSELDPLRDGSVYDSDVKKIFSEFGRLAVPDLFLRWGKQCIVIEAKFFTDPAEEEIAQQIKDQKEAIERIKRFTHYNDSDIKFIALTVNKSTDSTLKANGITCMTWQDILDITDKISKTSDIQYCINILRSSINRATEEWKKTDYSYDKLGFEDLLKKIPKLIDEGKIYVGFSGGIEKLNDTSLNELQSRSHFKVSKEQRSDEWIPLDQFLKTIIRLKTSNKIKI